VLFDVITHHLLVCADINLLRENLNIKKQVILSVTKEIGLEVNTEMCVFMSRHQNSRQNRNVKIINKSLENVESSRIWELQ
jgi:hypothetical protein